MLFTCSLDNMFSFQPIGADLETHKKPAGKRHKPGGPVGVFKKPDGVHNLYIGLPREPLGVIEHTGHALVCEFWCECGCVCACASSCSQS